MFEHTSGCIWFILVEWFGQNPKWIQIVLKRDWKMVWEKEKRILLSPSFLLFGSHGLALLHTKARPSLACLLPHSPAAPRAPLLLPLWCVRWGLEGEGTHPFSRSFISSCLGYSPKKIFWWNQMIFLSWSCFLQWLWRLPWWDHRCRRWFHRQEAKWWPLSHYLQGKGCFWAPPTKIATPGHRSRRGEDFKLWRWWICILCYSRRCNCQYSFIDLDVF